MNKSRVLQLAAAIAASDHFDMCHHMTCAIGHAQELATGYRHDWATCWMTSQFFEWLGIDPSTLPHNGKALWNPMGYRSMYQPACEPDLPEGMYLATVPKELAARVFEHFAETGEINWRI